MIAASFIPDTGIQTGFFAGLSVLAIVSAMDMTNGGLYASLMNQYGTKEESGAFVLMSLESGPLMTMVILGSAGLASFEPHHFIGAVLPFLIGFTLGNLDHDLRSFFSKATPVLIPFFGFALGNTINLSVIVDTGLLGILLGVAVIVITGIPLIIADRVIGGGNGTAGVAASSAAGAAVANPVIIAQINPAFEPVAASATALVAASVIVTAILGCRLSPRCTPNVLIKTGSPTKQWPPRQTLCTTKPVFILLTDPAQLASRVGAKISSTIASTSRFAEHNRGIPSATFCQRCVTDQLTG